MVWTMMSQSELKYYQSLNYCVPHEKFINLLGIRNFVLKTLLPEVEMYYIKDAVCQFKKFFINFIYVIISSTLISPSFRGFKYIPILI